MSENVETERDQMRLLAIAVLIGCLVMLQALTPPQAAAANAPEAVATTASANATSSATPEWMALGSDDAGLDGALNGVVYAMYVWKSDLYVGGNFTNAGGVEKADFLARWDGHAWSALGSNQAGTNGALTGAVTAISGDADHLYAGGTFGNAAGIDAADYVAAWDGNTWSALGSLGGGGALTHIVYAIGVSGSDVYVGGLFTNAAGIPTADYVARWNGASWSGLGTDLAGTNGAISNGNVLTMAVNGADVYVGGGFTDAGGVATADKVARWNGSVWSGLGSNGSGNGALTATVHVLEASGAGVYVGGQFQDAAGITQADYLGYYEAGNWSAVGSSFDGTNGALDSWVFSIEASGTDLYAGGYFLNARGDSTADHIARFSGGIWAGLGSNGSGNGAMNETVNSIVVEPGGVYAAGNFTNAGAVATADRVALYGVPTSYQPDGRLKKGSGALVGNDVYNADGTSQARTGKAAIGGTIRFTVSIQNDGDEADSFVVHATGAAAANYQIRFFKGTTDITSAVLAGTYQTTVLAPGAAFGIKAKVKVLAGATAGSSVTRLVSLTSDADGAAVDAVRFTVKRS